MSNARKLQTEIDRVMKKVDEGTELFDEIWEKVYSATQQSQKEKYEMDLKKEIKKLQRLRDQLKTWISGSDVKDKEPLLEYRKLIETKMEQFKICEKETKTKTYSKEGLARAERLSPEEEAKRDTCQWISDVIEKLNYMVEESDLEIEKLSAGKGKRTNKHAIDDVNFHMANHRFHLSKLEGIMRLVNNDVLDVDDVNPLKDDLEYYLDSHEDLDYQQAYDEEFFYEALGLEELDVVNVDRVTQAAQPTKKKEETDAASSGPKGTKAAKSSKKASSSMIPLTIGRARTSKGGKGKGKEEEEKVVTPTKRVVPAPAAIPVARPPAPAAGGASMAAILKRETEQQEKERQKARQAEQLRQQQQQQQQLQRQQQEAQLRQQQEALRLQQERDAVAQQKALQEQQQQQALHQQQAQLEALNRQQAQAQKQQQSQSTDASVSSQPKSGGVAGLDIVSGLGGLSLDSAAVAGDGSTFLSALNESFATMPTATETERSRQYAPKNPYPTPASYPGTPSQIFENPQVFEKLGTDCLFFIFYYAQGTYQQYLAARELKKQSWRFHKKYMTWFQRHEEPKVTTDEYEQGTYVYFDYETGWCTRIKQDFRFEYSFLEDTLQ